MYQYITLHIYTYIYIYIYSVQRKNSQAVFFQFLTRTFWFRMDPVFSSFFHKFFKFRGKVKKR